MTECCTTGGSWDCRSFVRALLGAAFGPDTTGELGYARRLLSHLDASMVLLADAYYDAYDFLDAVTGTGASFLLRSTRKRRPTVRRPLPDGSYLTTICAGRYQAGRGYGRLDVRIIGPQYQAQPVGRFCRSMYCFTTVRGAPPQLPAK